MSNYSDNKGYVKQNLNIIISIETQLVIRYIE